MLKDTFPVKSIVFVGTRQIGVNCLNHLIKAIKGTDTSIIGVLTSDKKTQWWSTECNPDVWQIAEQNKIPLITEDDLLYLNYDVLFCSIYLKIFSKEILDKAAFYNINLHPAPVPNYKGCWGYQHAIINQESEYGVSLHFMNEHIDSGDIIEVDKFPLQPTDTSKTVYLNALAAGFKLFQKWLPNILSNTLPRISQKDYSLKNNVIEKCYAYHSIANYFEVPKQTLSREEKNLLIRALTFPPLFYPPSWLTEK